MTTYKEMMRLFTPLKNKSIVIECFVDPPVKSLEEAALEESAGELLSPAVFKHGSRSFNTYAFPCW